LLHARLLARAGRPAEARAALDRLRQLDPEVLHRPEIQALPDYLALLRLLDGSEETL
jgi:hypothetical protein